MVFWGWVVAGVLGWTSVFAADEPPCAYFLADAPVRKLSILITAGATKEPLDGVRFTTNFSSGGLGRGFALAAAARGHHVVVLAPKEFQKMAGPLPEGVEHRVFFSTNDLKLRLEEASREQKWDLVLHSAAVADFTPAEVAQGKIASHGVDELIVRYVKTPKLIRSLRDLFGNAFLVGFKLLKDTPPEERYRIAMKQMRDCRTGLCIENDLSEVSTKSHKLRIITPEGGAIPVPVSDKNSVAKSVLNFIENRTNVRWYETIADPSMPKTVDSDKPGRLLQLAQKAGLLPDDSGNVSSRLTDDGLIGITPRSKDKSKLSPKDIVPIRVDLVNRKIRTNSLAVKPSTDSSVAGAVYTEFPGIHSMVHSHSPWYLGGNCTKFPFPCGVREEGDEIIRSARKSGADQGASAIVKLIDHGAILALGKDLSVEKLEAQWDTAQKDLADHWREMGFEEKDFDGGRSVSISLKKASSALCAFTRMEPFLRASCLRIRAWAMAAS